MVNGPSSAAVWGPPVVAAVPHANIEMGRGPRRPASPLWGPVSCWAALPPSVQPWPREELFNLEIKGFDGLLVINVSSAQLSRQSQPDLKIWFWNKCRLGTKIKLCTVWIYSDSFSNIKLPFSKRFKLTHSERTENVYLNSLIKHQASTFFLITFTCSMLGQVTAETQAGKSLMLIFPIELLLGIPICNCNFIYL